MVHINPVPTSQLLVSKELNTCRGYFNVAQNISNKAVVAPIISHPNVPLLISLYGIGNDSTILCLSLPRNDAGGDHLELVADRSMAGFSLVTLGRSTAS